MKKMREVVVIGCEIQSRILQDNMDFSPLAEKAQHDKLVALVDNILELQKKYHETRMEQDKELYERQIKLVDAQIDGLVYDLYGLTDEEIEIVEESL
jgi:Cys-tRNA synthase (O-phospho-L-seryl-tRNA:Cys-tRNA synthase)